MLVLLSSLATVVTLSSKLQVIHLLQDLASLLEQVLEVCLRTRDPHRLLGLLVVEGFHVWVAQRLAERRLRSQPIRVLLGGVYAQGRVLVPLQSDRLEVICDWW